jgi:hypothetical protein
VPVRTATLAHGLSGPASSGKTIYTCPQGRTAIVKDIRVVNRTGGSETPQIYITSGGIIVTLLNTPIPAQAVGAVQGFVVLEPGEQLHLNAVSTDGFAYHVSGSELDGVAPG